MIISNRDVFLGAHVTPQVKAAIRREAFRRGVSMSEFVYQILEEKLHLVPEEDSSVSRYLKEEDVPLPLEG